MTSPLPSRNFPEERRLATVLFADVQGFTNLAERMDFELVTDLIKEVWRLVDDIVEVHHGYVDKHIGDAVMAVWGAPFTGESDAEQAVHAALALQEAIVNFARNSELPGAHEIRIRVGIHTGMVLASYVGKRGEYTVMGDTVNIASRMQQVGEPDTVIISETTFRLVRGVFDVKRVSAPYMLRGKTTPVVGYLVQGIMPQPTRPRYRSLDSMETNMVGREVELDILNQKYQVAVQGETPILVLVTGEVGIGKSRLLMEFGSQLETSDTPAALISARALAQTSQVPFYIWKSIWFLRFGLVESDPVEVNREKFLREIQKMWGFQLGPASSVEVAHMIGSLIGLQFPESRFLTRFKGDPEGLLQRSFVLTRELLRRMSAYRPLVLVLDDLQSADQGSLDLILYLLEPSSEPLPMMILGGARHEFAQHNPRWLNYASIVELGPLAVSPETISRAYPALDDYPQEILLELAERSDGNPYFMEELAKSLLQSGLKPDSMPIGQMIERVRNLPLESLRVMLQSRLDALSHEARSVAMLAAISGRVFWVGSVLAAAQVGERLATGALGSFSSEVLDRLVQDALRQLVRAELAFPRANSPFSDDQEYIFKHALLREAAYSLIPHKHLPLYHQAVAQWLSNHAQLDFQLMAASHYVEARQFSQAAKLFEAAAEQALRQGAVRDAQSLLEEAKRLKENIGG
jgi:class 3 adenylate cyclase